ncbi:MAG: hypothetical protein ACOVRN_14840 [Flavobacterium sp.]
MGVLNEKRCKNIITGDYEVFYSGQNQGRLDYQLVDTVNSSSTFRIGEKVAHLLYS